MRSCALPATSTSPSVEATSSSSGTTETRRTRDTSAIARDDEVPGGSWPADEHYDRVGPTSLLPPDRRAFRDRPSDIGTVHLWAGVPPLPRLRIGGAGAYLRSRNVDAG